MASTVSLAVRSRLNLLPAGMEAPALPRYHPAPSRNEVAVVQPVLVSPPPDADAD